MSKRGRPPHPDILTPREWDVLHLLDGGLTNDQIAERLGISRDGAKYHVAQILSKLGVASRHEAAAIAYGQRPSLARKIAALPFALSLTRAVKLTAGTVLAGTVGALVVLTIVALLRQPTQAALIYQPGIYVLDLDSGDVERRVDLLGTRVTSFDWSADGRGFEAIVDAGGDARIVMAFDAATGALTGQEPGPPFESVRPDERRMPSPDGAAYAVTRGSNIELRDTATDALLGALSGYPGFANFDVSWSPDSNWLAAVNAPYDPAIPSELRITPRAPQSPTRVLARAATAADYWNGANWFDWAPDSRSIAFVRDGALWTADIASGLLRERLTPSTPVVTEPRWSPDGRAIAFRAAGSGGIHVAAADGSASDFVAPGDTARLSRDGRQIAIEYGGKILVLDSEGTDARTIATLFETVVIRTDFYPRRFCQIQFPPSFLAPAWSADGTYLLYNGPSLDEGTAPDVFLSRTDGKSAPRKVAEGYTPTFSPDGKHIAFVRDCEVHLMRLERSGAVTTVASLPGYVHRWLEDGTVVVSLPGAAGAVYSVDGTRLRDAPAAGLYSPTTGQVAVTEHFRTPGEGDSSSPDSRMTVLDGDGKLVAGPFEHAAPDGFSPDGRYLAYGERLPFQPNQTLLILDLAQPAAAPRKAVYVRDIDSAVWSPDSTKLAYIERFENAPAALMVLDLTTVRTARIGQSASVPQWFPDSKQLLYVGPQSR